MVQWLGLLASNAGGTSSLPGEGTKILHAVHCDQKKKNILAIQNAGEDMEQHDPHALLSGE